MPKRGNKARGTNAVTATGRASVAHQIPINRKRAAVLCPSGDKFSGVGNSRTKTATTTPRRNPKFSFISDIYSTLNKKGSKCSLFKAQCLFHFYLEIYVVVPSIILMGISIVSVISICCGRSLILKIFYSKSNSCFMTT